MTKTAQALCPLLAVMAVGCVTLQQRAQMAVRAYPGAPVITAQNLCVGTGAGTFMRQWSAQFAGWRGERVMVESNGVRVKVHLPGEIAPQVLYDYTDYMYPVELRASGDGRFVYLEVTGTALRFETSRKETWLLAYDLERRTPIGRILTASETRAPARR